MGGGRYFLNQVAHIRIFWLLFPPNEGTDALVISFLHLNEPIDSIAEKKSMVNSRRGRVNIR